MSRELVDKHDALMNLRQGVENFGVWIDMFNKNPKNKDYRLEELSYADWWEQFKLYMERD